MDDELVSAFDTRTGDLLPNPVPSAWLGIFPYLSTTPRQRADDPAEPLARSGWTVTALRTHAEDRGIDLGSARTKAEILDVLTEHDTPTVVDPDDTEADTGQKEH